MVHGMCVQEAAKREKEWRNQELYSTTTLGRHIKMIAINYRSPHTISLIGYAAFSPHPLHPLLI